MAPEGGGGQHAECCIQPVTAFAGGSVMVWGGITLTNKTPLIQINGNLNSIRYVAEILRPHVVPHAAAIGDGFILMDDNTRPHRGRVVTEFLAGAAIERMLWPANSPDLNPIELRSGFLYIAESQNTSLWQTWLNCCRRNGWLCLNGE